MLGWWPASSQVIATWRCGDQAQMPQEVGTRCRASEWPSWEAEDELSWSKETNMGRRRMVTAGNNKENSKHEPATVTLVLLVTFITWGPRGPAKCTRKGTLAATLPIVEVMRFFRSMFQVLWQSHMHFMWKIALFPFCPYIVKQPSDSDIFLSTYPFLPHPHPHLNTREFSSTCVQNCIIFHRLNISVLHLLLSDPGLGTDRENTGTAVDGSPLHFIRSFRVQCWDVTFKPSTPLLLIAHLT